MCGEVIIEQHLNENLATREMRCRCATESNKFRIEQNVGREIYIRT